MEIIKTDMKKELPKVVVLGNLDGIHKGHLMLINEAKKVAHNKKIQSALFTFYPHPSYILKKSPVDMIYTAAEKQKVLEHTEIDFLIQYPFSKEVANLEPYNFIKDILVDKINVDTVIVGKDFRFGINRKGNIEYIKKISKKLGFEVIVFEKLKYNGREISSTWIRELIKEGNIELANYLMDRSFFFLGTVTKGQQIGRTIGFPTANIIPDSIKILPPNGVYVSKVIINDEQYDGITNIGKKPTVNGKELTIETHILNFNKDIYNQEIQIDLLRFLRHEKMMSSLDELKQQIKTDIKQSLKYTID